MSDTIESFVTKLQTEGVEAGRQAAEDLCAEARQQADQIVRGAKDQAAKIVADAKVDGEKLLERSRTELELAARDVFLRLREALDKALAGIIAAEVSDKLPSTDFLSQTLHDLVLLYAKADIDRKQEMKINVSPEIQGQLADWAIQEMTRTAKDAGMGFDLKGTLSTAGFEYQVSDGTVEVTLDSVVETLCELISPRLREVVDKAINEIIPEPRTEAKEQENSSRENR